MKTYTTTVREGEYLGPVDWDYDFRKHFDGYCTSDEHRQEFCNRAVEILRKISDDTKQWEANTSGFWHEVYHVGMYDGWPYWKPTPALLVAGTLGPQWEFFYQLRDCREKHSTPNAAP